MYYFQVEKLDGDYNKRDYSFNFNIFMFLYSLHDVIFYNKVLYFCNTFVESIVIVSHLVFMNIFMNEDYVLK